MSIVVKLQGAREAPKAARSKMDTLLVTAEEVQKWQLPPFQRPLRENEKVRALAEGLKRDGGVLSGVITLGRLGSDRSFYIVDGQHRIHGFRISGLRECIMDVRICDFDSMAEMAETFVELNSSLVRMRPDDVLRGMEASTLALRTIRKACPFVGYDQIRRNSRENSSIVSMSAVLRCWSASAAEVPAATGTSALMIAQSIDIEEARRLVTFLEHAMNAWGRDPEYHRLWSSLNLTICMWMWRRIVLQYGMTGLRRFTSLKAEQFGKCMTALSANGEYLDWLIGRNLSDANRNPCYSRIKTIFAKRLGNDGITGVKFPAAAWVS